MLKLKRKFLFGAMCIFLLMIMLFAITLGIADISFLQSIKIVLSKIPLISKFIDLKGMNEISKTIIIDIRMPRILIAAIVGMGLSVVGSTFQGIFRNPMAEPYILGVSSGSALGASIAIVLGIGESFCGMSLITFFAFLGALLTVLVVYNIARVGNKVHTSSLLLAGIAVSSLMSSVISVIMIFNRQQVEKIVFWTMGSFSTANWQQVSIIAPIVLIGTIIIFFFSRELDVILIGDETAKSVGVEAEKVRKLLLIISSIIVAAIVSISGIIGFVGLIVPHTLRMLVGSRHRLIIPFSAVGGAIFMIIVDTIARTIIPPIEIPVGAVTAICGTPYFIYLLSKNKRGNG